MELNYRATDPRKNNPRDVPNLPDNGALLKIPQINQCRLSAPSLHPLSPCIITKITIMKILSASQPPSPHFPLLPFRPPAHCLAHSRRRKFIKMKLRLQLTGFIKIYLALADIVCLCFTDKVTKKASEIIWSV